MTRCFVIVASAFLLLITTSMVVSAQDLPDRVRSYFPGKWESKGGPNGDGSVEWRLMAGGKAVAGPGVTASGGASFGMGGWKSKEGIWVHSWFEGNGGYGITELNRFEDGTYFGKTHTVDGGGDATEGEFQIVVKDDNHFTLKIVTSDGTIASDWTRSK